MARGADNFTPADILISEATADAIHAAGKQDFVSHVLGRSRTTLMGWASEEAAEFIPLRMVPELEKLGLGRDGAPHITRALAKMQGFELFRLPAVDTASGDWLAMVGSLSCEAAGIIGKVCASLDDQRVCAADVRKHDLITEAEQLVSVAVTLLAWLRGAGE